MTVATSPEDFYTEHRTIHGATSLSADIARHLYEHLGSGQAIVITTKPSIMLSSVSKQWQQIVRQVERDRSRTLNASRIRSLTEKLATMQHYQFTSKQPNEVPHADLFFALPSIFIASPNGCRTVYVTHPLTTIELNLIKQAIPKKGLLVQYDLS